MKNSTEMYKKKLYEIYSITSIPVALVDDMDNFDLLYPQSATSPQDTRHSRRLKGFIEENNLPMNTPLIKHIFLSTFYCVLQLDDEHIVQLGPVASHDINIKKYISYMQKIGSPEIVAHHMKIIQGAPKVDLNYFINAVILTTHFLCNREIDRNEIYYDSELREGTISVSPKYLDRITTSVDQLSLDDEIYNVIKTGNIKRFEELKNRNKLSSFNFYKENDMHFLRIAIIFYGSISCHYATLGGLPENEVKDSFRKYLNTISVVSEPEELWKLLPFFSESLCHKVHELNSHKTDSDILNSSIRFIEKNIYSKITIEDLEGYTHASRKTILRHFKEYLHTTPSEYISDAKLKEVAYQLEESDLNIIDISIMLNYSSQSHMNRNFIKKYGCTPLQYRKDHR